jgi:hypothetical protein
MARMTLVSVVVLGLATACGGVESSLADAGRESGTDAATQSGRDSGIHNGTDSGTHPATDSGRDSGTHSGRDAGGGDGGCPSYCAMFTPGDGTCADFDESSVVPKAWKVTTSEGGTVTISTAEAFSCSNSLSSTLPMESVSVGSADAYAASSFITPDDGVVSLDLEIYLPTNDTMSYVSFFALVQADAGPLGLQHHADANWYLSDGPTVTIEQQLTTPPLLGAWNHMTLAVRFSRTAGTASLTYEGNDHAPHAVSYSGPTSPGAAVNGEAFLGMIATGATEGDFTTYYDNVFVAGE